VGELAAHSVIVGAIPGATFATAEADLEPGEMLVMYTDGLTEARRDTELFGVQRLHAAIALLAGHTAEEVVETLFETVRRYADDSFSDDIAIVALRMLPRAGVAAPAADCATAG
jgi:serine phosphatase RsbU (regulator of sigma subunit)